MLWLLRYQLEDASWPSSSQELRSGSLLVVDAQRQQRTDGMAPASKLGPGQTAKPRVDVMLGARSRTVKAPLHGHRGPARVGAVSQQAGMAWQGAWQAGTGKPPQQNGVGRHTH